MDEAKSSFVIVRESTKRLIREVLAYEGLECPEIDTFESIRELAKWVYEKNDGFTPLLNQLFKTYAHIKPLDSEKDWFDSLRLDSICTPFTMVTWKMYDSDEAYSVQRDPLPINQNTVLDFSRARKILVNPLRTFILKGDDDKDICDKAYLHYPFFWGGCHGCDIFWLKGRCLTLQELYNFSSRYPSAIIGFILNTCTYAEGGGEHWTAFLIKNKTAYLICSFGSDFSCFHEKRFYPELMKLGFAIRFNSSRLQTDHYSCGMYSTLMNYLMLSTDCDIAKSVDMLGVGGKSLIEGKDINDYVKVLAGRQ